MWSTDEHGFAVWIPPSIEDYAPIMEVYKKPETEEEKQKRLWRIVVEFSR